MMQSQVDPCILYKRDEDKLVTMVLLEVDDSMITGSSTFHEVEEKESKGFVSKARLPLQIKPSHFNGVEISIRSDGTI